MVSLLIALMAPSQLGILPEANNDNSLPLVIDLVLEPPTVTVGTKVDRTSIDFVAELHLFI